MSLSVSAFEHHERERFPGRWRNEFFSAEVPAGSFILVLLLRHPACVIGSLGTAAYVLLPRRVARPLDAAGHGVLVSRRRRRLVVRRQLGPEAALLVVVVRRFRRRGGAPGRRRRASRRVGGLWPVR